jgi:Fur family transcriptional regulator, ferric uptake regulator
MILVCTTIRVSETMDDPAVLGERRLKASGKRITPQRRLVLGILAHADGHLDAQDIYERGRRQDASLSLSTVYRTLTVLKEAGLVSELHLDTEHHHYELGSKNEHSHLVCITCGRVIEVDSAAFAEATTALARGYGFEVASARVELAGFCKDCRSDSC